MKIMLIADVHNRPNSKNHDKTLNALERVINSEECDLIVFLGDTVHGPDITENYEKYLREVLDLTGNKPFATVFGNHDDECSTTKEEILNIVSSYENSVTNGQNYVVQMQGETLLFIDSGSYFDGEESYYDTVKEEQIKFALDNIKDKKAILFQHIIVPNIMKIIDSYKFYRIGCTYDGKRFYRFKKSVKYSGKLLERPCPPNISTGEFEALSPYLKAVCFGHDHNNSFELDYRGVKIIQCAGAGYNSYDKHLRSSVKILDTKTLNTKQIFI